MIGAATLTAASITLQIFSAWVSEREPPKTVESGQKTNTCRELMVP